MIRKVSNGYREEKTTRVCYRRSVLWRIYRKTTGSKVTKKREKKKYKTYENVRSGPRTD